MMVTGAMLSAGSRLGCLRAWLNNQLRPLGRGSVAAGEQAAGDKSGSRTRGTNLLPQRPFVVGKPAAGELKIGSTASGRTSGR